MRIAAIIPAAGRGKRLKGKILKPFVPVCGKPLLSYTIWNLRKAWRFQEMILAVPEDQSQNFKKLLKEQGLGRIQVVAGGRTRAESVRNGLERVSNRCDWVLVHDAARPLVSRSMVRRLIQGARKTGAAIAALPVTSTVKRVNTQTHRILRTENRESLSIAQTPQVFRKKLLVDRYRALGRRALSATDEAALFDGSKTSVHAVLGEARNIKITTPEDVKLFAYYLKQNKDSKCG